MSETLDYALDLVRAGVLSVGSDGAIWRHAEVWPDGIRKCSPRRAESVGGKGYLSLVLWIDEGRARRVMAHRLVWAVLKGPIPDELQINHKDLNKKNNVPTNLELMTGAENIQHSYANGRRHPWSNATQWRGRHRLTPEDIAEAKRMRSDGVLLRDIAKRFGIGTTHAHRITS